jgi:hypothetical protein
MFDDLRRRLGRASERYPDARAPHGRTGAEPGRLRGTSALSSWWVSGVGAALVLGGALGGLWGLLYLRGALSPDNRTNPFREIGVAAGAVATSLAAIILLGGVGLVWASSRSRRASPAGPSRRAGSRGRRGSRGSRGSREL